MVRLAHWTLLLLAATCAAAQDQPTAAVAAALDAQTPSKTCIAPDVVTGFEQKISALEVANADVAARLAAATKELKSEKASLAAQLEKEQSAHRSTATLLRNANANSDKTIALLEKKLADAESKYNEQLQRLEAQVQALEASVATATSELAAQTETVATRDVEVAASREKLQQYAAKVKALEKDVLLSRKSNEALRSELKLKEETEISLSALLSSYYDEGVVVAANTVAALREHAGQSSDTLTKVVDTLESTKKTVVDSTDKFYSENLAATVDPILADIRTAADPHVKKYLPIVQEEAERAKTEAIKLSHEGLKRAKSARLDAIALLEQNENVRTHAQKIVDGVLIAIAVPLVLLQFRLVLRLAWWLLTTAVCVLTLGCCCGRKRSKRKASSASRKTTTAVQEATTILSSSNAQQKKKQTTNAASTATKRSGKKSSR